MNTRTYPCYLQKNRQCETPSKFIAVDTEASIEVHDDHEVHTLRLGEALFVRKKEGRWRESPFSFNTKEEFHEFVLSKMRPKEPIRIIGHNMAYDATILDLDSFYSKHDMKIKSFVLEPYIVKLESAYGTVHTLSSTNWFHFSLKKLGKIIGVEKMESPDFYDHSIPDNVMRPYCKQDALIVARAMEWYFDGIKERNLGNFNMTIAGQAFACFKHRWMDEKTILLHRYPLIEELERTAYLGGRCEAFRLGSFTNIYKLDVNSMYPFVMKNNSFPVKMISGERPVSEDAIVEAIANDRFVIAECDIDLKENAIGIRRDKLIFPRGHIKTVLTDPEIRYLLDQPEIGEIVKIHKGAIYDTLPIFSGYVDMFYEMKVTAKTEAETMMAKLFLNALYGKFGQREHPELEPIERDSQEYREIASDLDDLRINSYSELYHDQLTKVIRIGEDIFRIPARSGRSSPEAFPAISATVTALARVYLDRMIRIAGRSNVIYCDTDSIFCTQEGYERLGDNIDPKRLGALKLEEIGDVTIRGLKNYTFNGHTKMKGIRADAKEVDPNVFEQKQFCTRASHYTKGHRSGEVVIQYIRKEVSTEYDKGEVRTNGIIEPFICTEW